MPGVPETKLEILESKVRTAEARISMLEDWRSMRPIHRLPIPELSREQRFTAFIVLAYLVVIGFGIKRKVLND
jgi:hypothetical protein